MYSEFFQSFQKDNFGDILPVFAIYYYTDGINALTISNAEESSIFAYLKETSTSNFIDVISFEFNKESNEKSANFSGIEQPKVLISSLLSGEVFFEAYDSDSLLKSKQFSECMKKSLESLYNDWDGTKEVIGSLACWSTGMTCVAAAAIHCTLEKIRRVEQANPAENPFDPNPFDLIKINDPKYH